MKVFVTGATGLLGNNIVRELVSREIEVCGLVHQNTNSNCFSNLPVEIKYGDICDYNSLLTAAENFDIIIHCAALTKMNARNESYEKVNIEGTKNILNAAEFLKIKRLVYVSTSNVLGPGSKENPGNELSPYAFSKFNSGYIRSKFDAQQLVTEFSKTSSFEIISVAPTFILGPYDFGPSSGQIILMGLRNKIVLCPRGGKNFVSAIDASIAVCNSITMGQNGEIYLLASENLTYKEFFSKIELITNKKLIKIPVPKFILLFLGIIGSCLEFILFKPLSLNYTNAKLLCLDNYFVSKKAIEEIELENKPIDETLRIAIDWFGKSIGK